LINLCFDKKYLYCEISPAEEKNCSRYGVKTSGWDTKYISMLLKKKVFSPVFTFNTLLFGQEQDFDPINCI
jgi:hypothetical protein